MLLDGWRHWSGFWRRPTLPPEQLRAFQGRQLSRLVSIAARRTPFYRALFEQAGLNPTSIRDLDDLARIPLTQKAAIQQATLEERLASGVEPAHCVERRTSGSTGRPVRVLRSQREEHRLFAYSLRTQLQLGLQLRDRRLGAGLSDISTMWPHRLGLLPISALDPFLSPARVVAELERRRPHAIHIRSDLLHEVVRQADPGALRIPGLRLVFCGGTVTSACFRREAEAAFGCPVIDIYGAHELNKAAFECRDCGCYHVIDDAVIVEVLKPDGSEAGPGERGSVYVTALHSYAMPFIRYGLGDIASRPADPKPCRFGFSRLASIEGRRQQILEFAGGVVIHPGQIFAQLFSTPGVGRFQVLRAGESAVEIRVEALPQRTPALDEVRRRCGEIFPQDVAINVQAGLVEDAESPKHDYVRTSPPTV